MNILSLNLWKVWALDGVSPALSDRHCHKANREQTPDHRTGNWGHPIESVNSRAAKSNLAY